MPDYEPLWYWIIERENIRLRKEHGAGFPWTTDPILQTYRFCCVRREDDLVTRWIREHIRDAFANHPNLWLMLCIARMINWPESLAQLIENHAWPLNDDFQPNRITKVLNMRKAYGAKVYTGAYMISAPAEKGADKQAYIAETVIGDLWRRRDDFIRSVLLFPGDRTLENAHAWIMRSNGWGNFMAYQAVVDMRFTGLFEDAPDVRTWAAAGPGTIRGLNRVHGRNVEASLSQGQALVEMREIYKRAWKATRVAMDFSDVPNALCETDKYLRVKLGQGKPRALYVPGRGA